MSLRLAPLAVTAMLAACGSKSPPDPGTTPPAADVTTPPSADATPVSADATPVSADAAPASADVASPSTDASAASADASSAPPAPPPREPSVLAPAGTSPTAVALDGKGASAALAVADPTSQSGRSVVRVFDLTGPWPGTPDAPAPSVATVPEALLPAGLGFAPSQLALTDTGPTLAALGKVTEDGKPTSRWHVHAWRFHVDEPEGKPPVPTWTSVFARTFASTQTPILILQDDGARLFLGGYGATAWALPELPLEQPVPAEPRPTLSMPTESGWWLPTGEADAEPPAFRIVEMSAPGEPKAYGALATVLTAEAANAELDRERLTPLPTFSNASVRAAGALLAAEPLDAKRPPVALTLFVDELKPVETVFGADSVILAVGPDTSMLFADGTPRALYAVPAYSNEVRLPEAFAAATLGAIGVEAILVVPPDGSVHLLPMPDAPPDATWAEATDLSALPPAFLPLFSKEGFALEGRSAQTSYDEDDSGKVTRTALKGRCAADTVEVCDGLYHAIVSCSDLVADYVVDFSGHWYATADRLWFRPEPASDLVSLRRSPAPFGLTGGCLTERSGEAHPEVSERCLDAKGPSKTRFEGGPAAYQVEVELRRAK